jgi:hypothetical protein
VTAVLLGLSSRDIVTPRSHEPETLQGPEPDASRGGFELYRYKHAERMSTRGWSGLYWARKNEAGDYEIRTVTKEGEGYSYPGDVFSKEAFERFYEKAD